MLGVTADKPELQGQFYTEEVRSLLQLKLCVGNLHKELMRYKQESNKSTIQPCPPPATAELVQDDYDIGHD